MCHKNRKRHYHQNLKILTTITGEFLPPAPQTSVTSNKKFSAPAQQKFLHDYHKFFITSTTKFWSPGTQNSYHQHVKAFVTKSTKFLSPATQRFYQQQQHSFHCQHQNFLFTTKPFITSNIKSLYTLASQTSYHQQHTKFSSPATKSSHYHKHTHLILSTTKFLSPAT